MKLLSLKCAEYSAVFLWCNSLGRPYICLRQSRLVIGQFGRSGLPPSDAKRSLALKVNVQIFQLGTTF